jgi:hypothetical protein
MHTQTPQQPQNTNQPQNNTLKIILIVVGSMIATVFLLMVVSIVAVTMLGRNASHKLTSVASEIQ